MENSHADQRGLDLEIEAAPENITIQVHGQRFAIGLIDEEWDDDKGKLALITATSNSVLTVPPRCVAIVISSHYRVVQVVEALAHSVTISVPSEGFILTAADDVFDQRIMNVFHVGHTVKVRNQGKVIVYQELIAKINGDPHLMLDQAAFYTEIQSNTVISGSIVNKCADQTLALIINGAKATVNEQNKFLIEFRLAEGANEFELKLQGEAKTYDTRRIVVYYFKPPHQKQQVFLWVEQGHNLLQLSEPRIVREMLQSAKKAGVTAVVVDVKGVEGFAGYKRTELTKRPNASCMQAPGRAGANPNIDILLEFTKAGKELDIEIHAAFNVFAEGSYYRNEFGLPNILDSGGQYVLHPDDHNEIVQHQKSMQVEKGKAMIAYVNPADDAIRAFELNNIEEVMKHYDIDGVVLDRCRYDDEHADFSEMTRVKFSTFVEEKGKRLLHWPEDIFMYRDGIREDGPLLNEWWEFRAYMITTFVEEVRKLVDSYNRKRNNNKLQLSAYVGSWYEYAYRYGINWSSRSYQYDRKLNWPEENLYTSDYMRTGYIGLLDHIFIGAYQQSLQEIEHYITMAHLVTNDEIPIIAGIALPYVQQLSMFPAILQTGLNKSSGLMLFDHCHINWSIVENAMPPHP